MPEYLAPGVFVEETSFRQKTIEGVSTSTSGFVGPTRYGPVRGEPSLLTSFSEFERIYGGLDQLEFAAGERTHNYLAHAVRAFFEEGGRRLYVARTFTPRLGDDDGIARWQEGSPAQFSLTARYPGAAGNMTVTFQLKLGPELYNNDRTALNPNPAVRNVLNYDTVWVETSASPGQPGVYWADTTLGPNAVRFRQDDEPAGQEPDGSPSTALEMDDVTSVRKLTVTVLIDAMGQFGEPRAWEDLTFHPMRKDSLSQIFEPEPVSKRSTSLFVPLVFASGLNNGAGIAQAMLLRDSLARPAGSPPSQSTISDGLSDSDLPTDSRLFRVRLAGGNDGGRPDAGAYDGDADDPKSGLRALEDIEDISIIAAPGSTHTDNGDTGQQVTGFLISHCERMRYRVAVLDSANGHTPGEVQEARGRIDTTRAAFYYPWVRIYDPLTRNEILAPPSGFVTGIYARNDVERGVHKSPANEVVRLALGFETLINTAQQEVLNPLGINCLRFFEGRGHRVWGARTASSDPEWKYLNVRRYFIFLERSIEKGTQWAVFENNGPVLWSNVSATIQAFLFNEWKENRLLGTKPEQAYFVRCDLTTMTQNDLDNGRLICLVGVAPLRPAEFVIFRIGQKTADSRS